MWFLPPSMSSPCSPESAGLTSESGWRFLELERSVTWRGKALASPSSLRGWRTADWTRLLSGAMWKHSTAARGVASWIASLRDSRARMSATRGNAWGLNVGSRPDSGSSAPASFAMWDRTSSCWRMSQDLFDAECQSFSATWPKWGSLRSGAAYERTPLELPTGESGGSSLQWQTPSAGCFGSRKQRNGKREFLLPLQAKAWSTPTVNGNHNRRGESNWPTPCQQNWRSGLASDQTMLKNARPLQEVVARWSTPVRTNWRSRKRICKKQGRALQEEAILFSPPAPETRTAGSDSSISTPRLNPRFVEILLGLPAGWTDCAPSATRWCRYRRLLRFVFSRLDWEWTNDK